MVSALVYLHSRRVIHCDLKEANCVIAEDSHWQTPRVVVIGFGLAKGFHHSTAGWICGSPGCMPTPAAQGTRVQH